MELPKTGVSSLLAANSNDMVAIPAINTRTRRTICKEEEAGFKNNTYFLMLCIVDFIYMVKVQNNKKGTQISHNQN